MPKIRTIIEITLDDVNEGTVQLDNFDVGDCIRIDLITVKESMDEMSEKIEACRSQRKPRGEYHD